MTAAGRTGPAAIVRSGRRAVSQFWIGAAVAATAVAGLSVAAPARGAVPAPTVVGVAGRSGPEAGGQLVTLHGTGFSDVSAIRFGSVDAAGYHAWSGEELTVRVPGHGAATVYVTITTEGGTSAFNAAARYVYVPAPRPLVVAGAKRPTPAVGAVHDLSCPTSTFCAVVGTRGVSTYDGSRWSPVTRLGLSPQSVSCASPKFCVAISLTGDAYRYDGTRWHGSIHGIGQYGQATPVSCGSPILCVVVGDDNAVTEFTGSTWSVPHNVFGYPSQYEAVACSGSAFCLLVDDAGGMARYDGQWHASPSLYYNDTVRDRVSPRITGHLSCTSATFCLGGGNLFALFTGQTWSPGQSLLHTSGRTVMNITAVECATPTFCLIRWAAGPPDDGQLTRWTVLNGTAAAPLRAAADATVSCWARYRCLIVDPRSYVVTKQG